MPINDSVQFFLRFVDQKHSELINSLSELVHALVGEDVKKKKSRADVVLMKANDLKSGLSNQDFPNWLKPLIQILSQFQNGSKSQQALIDFILKNERNIKNHNWNIDSQHEYAFDFDSIFEHYKSESRLPDLFDEIISILEKIKASGEIDSISMLNSLTKVIATLKKNKNGSYFSMNSAWSFFTSFLKYYFLAEISKLPGLGSFVEALQKAADETNQELININHEVKQEMKNAVEDEIKPLANKTEFRFLAYDETANSEQSSSNSNINHKA